eukprot:m.131492 g.131492  ORF g.131492 m.131492 type:complete len:252 (-) comp16820_c0_seq5:1658-2413(-)
MRADKRETANMRDMAAMAAFAATVVLATMTSVHGDNPVLPQFFIANMTQRAAFASSGPPYAGGVPDPPFLAGRAVSYYDWSREAMVEHYIDTCVPIFAPNASWSCTFQNVGGAAYLITYDDRPAGRSPCCLFGKPWHPPRPTFLRSDVNASLTDTTQFGCGTTANWYKIDIPPPTGPFFYAFDASVPTTKEQVYLAFDFPAYPGGWAVQNFHDVRIERPDPSIWELPESCKVPNLPDCSHEVKAPPMFRTN